MASEREPDLDHLLRRLGLLGATPDELRAVRDGWGIFDDQWTAGDQHRLVRAPDAELSRKLAEVRAEYTLGTTTVEEAAAVDRAAAQAAAVGEAARFHGATPQQIAEWVDGDPLRAWAMIRVEESTVRPRKKVLAALAGLGQEWELS